MTVLEQPIDAAAALDIFAIQQCLGRAVLGNDLLDIPLWKSAYWPDATEDHGWYHGNAHRFIDETLVMLERDMDTTWHAPGVPVIVVDGIKARSIAYFTAYVRLKATDGGEPQDLLSGGRYIDRLEKREGVWRIMHRISKGDWIRIDPASYEWGQPGLGGYIPQMGMRATNDPGRLLFAEEEGATR